MGADIITLQEASFGGRAQGQGLRPVRIGLKMS